MFAGMGLGLTHYHFREVPVPGCPSVPQTGPKPFPQIGRTSLVRTFQRRCSTIWSSLLQSWRSTTGLERFRTCHKTGLSWTGDLDEPTILEADLRSRAVNVPGVNPLCSCHVRRDARAGMGRTEDLWHGAHTTVVGATPVLSAFSLMGNIGNLLMRLRRHECRCSGQNTASSLIVG